MWSCACAPAPAAGRDAAKHCQPFDRKSRTPDWPVPPQSGHGPSPGSRWPCDQLLDLSLNRGSARASTGLRAIEFAGDKLAIPTQDGVRPSNGRDIGENLAAQAVTDLAK